MDRSILSLDKGQAFAPDFIASMAVMGVMLTAFFISWNAIIDSQLAAAEDEERYTESQKTVNHLINSPGVPGNWDRDNVEAVGLAERPHVLNRTKIEEFQELDYGRQRSLLNSQGFKLRVIEQSGENLYEIGGEIEDENVNTFSRDAVLNDSQSFRRVEVKYISWH